MRVPGIDIQFYDYTITTRRGDYITYILDIGYIATRSACSLYQKVVR